jgi:lysophospholipase L1-like esterase
MGLLNNVTEFSKIIGIFVSLLLIILVTSNAVIGFYSWITKKVTLRSAQQQALSKYKKVYPNLSNNQIHQLLEDTWSLRMIFDSYTHFTEQRSYKTKYVNISPYGFRETKHRLIWPPDNSHLNIFFFGGSTTFGYGVADNETIPAYFHEFAAKDQKEKVSTYNFGRGFYFSTQEQILLNKFLEENIQPDLVVFLDGINDFLLVDGEPADLRSMKSFFNGTMDWLRLVCEFKMLRLFPLVKYLQKISSRRSEQSQQTESEKQFQVKPMEVISKTAQRYLKNIRIVDCISKEFGFENLFVFQPSPYFKAQSVSHIFYKTKVGALKYGKEYQEMGYQYMESQRQNLEDKHNFLWLADMQESSPENLYCDALHYNSKFNQMIASRIYEMCKIKDLFQRKTSVRQNAQGF